MLKRNDMLLKPVIPFHYQQTCGLRMCHFGRLQRETPINLSITLVRVQSRHFRDS